MGKPHRNTSGINWHDYFSYDEGIQSCLQYIGPKSGNRKMGNGANLKGGKIKYWCMFLAGRWHKCHRIIYEMFYGAIGKFDIDHINGNSGDNRIQNLRSVTNALNTRNRSIRSDNTTGCTGVSFINTSTTEGGKVYYYLYWAAIWTDFKTDKVKAKRFSINKYGYDEAFRLACAHRAAMIEQLNLQGAGYTDTHGIRNSH